MVNNMISIQSDKKFSLKDIGLSKTHLEKAVQIAINFQKVDPNVDVSIVLTGDKDLHRLNSQFMNIDAPTDVLSFPAAFVDPDSGATNLGDIIISVERAKEQAAAQNHPVAAEILLLVIHGMLHLLGHDHADSEEKQRMWAAQAAIAEQVARQTGIQPALPAE